MPLTDANTVTEEQDVDLVVGETVVKVKITAEDTSTVQTYTVTITRRAEDTSLSPPPGDPVAANASTAVYSVTFQGHVDQQRDAGRGTRWRALLATESAGSTAPP